MSQNIWNFQNNFVSLHRQNVSFGYPGKFPERASRIRHYPFKTTSGWFYLFSEVINHHLQKSLTGCYISPYRNFLLSRKYQHLGYF